MSSGIFKPVFRLTCGGFLFGLLALIGGCGKNPRSVENAEVSGKVLFQGKPLPGGQVSFVAVSGGFNASAIINEDGTYKINAPIGEVRIGVDNLMLQSSSGGGGKGGRQKSGPPIEMRHPKLPSAEMGKGQPLKGRWIPIPTQYQDPAKSGLTYTVTKGPQTHDIELSENPPPPPDNAGP